MAPKLNIDLTSRRGIALLATIVSIVISAIGFFYFRNQVNQVREKQNIEFAAISKLKTDQIIQWQKERNGDALAISHSPLLISAVERLFDNKNNNGLNETISKHIAVIEKELGYEHIYLLTIKGEPLLSEVVKRVHFDPITYKTIDEAVASQTITWTNLYYSSKENQVNYDIIAPIVNEKNRTIAVLVFHIEPEDYLYPLIQSYPFPSRSSESLLVRKENDSVVFLNELRQQKNTALRLKIPLTAKEVPAVQAVLGYTGLLDGKDYRGIDVIADIQKVPDTDWFIITKIDKSEMYAELYHEGAYIITGFCLILMIVVGGMVFLYRNRQRNIYKELLRSSAEHLTTLQSIGEAVIKADVNGTIQYMNPVAEQLTGWKENETKGLPIEKVFRIIDEETRKTVDNPVARVLREGVIVLLDNPTLLISRKGKEIPIDNNGAPIKNETGEITGVVLVFRDITDRKQAEKDLQSSELKYRNQANFLDVVIENSPFAMHVMDAKGVIIRANQALRDILNVTDDMIVGKYNVLHDENLVDQGLMPVVEAVFNDLKSARFNLFWTGTKAGDVDLSIADEHWIDVSMFPITDEAGKLVNVVCQYVDITEINKAHEAIKTLNEDLEKRVIARTEELQYANKELEAFSYSVSHDLRSPIRAIDGFTKKLFEDYNTVLDDEGNRLLGIVLKSTKNMGQLIDDLLAFSRLGRKTIETTTINMEELVKEVSNELHDANKDRKLRITIKHLPQVIGDRALVRQAMVNLLANSIKYTKTRETAIIEIGNLTKDHQEIFYVKDNGVGFDMKYVHKIFDVFQRLHSAKEFEGTGIGLAIVQRIIHRHGGKIWAEAEVNKGATFYFSLTNLNNPG